MDKELDLYADGHGSNNILLISDSKKLGMDIPKKATVIAYLLLSTSYSARSVS